ncbi:hypothetical protein HMPREF1979_00109 [Actinomyces johnsonii F0542]|uniref:Uncharacterized protein n=1 Tax=Actinomyces johnsonii F0542 TaxID=1321818 RepID=U1S5H5_9ACTO|nr:hypothetical protein HMPREF1979_00109 [Actinomyces johnsonii F0542]
MSPQVQDDTIEVIFGGWVRHYKSTTALVAGDGDLDAVAQVELGQDAVDVAVHRDGLQHESASVFLVRYPRCARHD